MQATAAVLSQWSRAMVAGAAWRMDVMATMAAMSSSAFMWREPLAMSLSRSAGH
jgi:hypothetical protein